jgi:hypothetical protein
MIRSSHFRAIALLAAGGLLCACGDGGLAGGLRSAGVAATPDEFMVLPTKPLELPDNLAARPLPPPTTGSANRVDQNPRAEALVGLTGRPAAATASGEALVARVGPGEPGIRATLAAEDSVYRRENRGLFFERLFSRDQEALTYRGMTLDAGAEFELLRSQGVRQPPAPPTLLGQ